MHATFEVPDLCTGLFSVNVCDERQEMKQYLIVSKQQRRLDQSVSDQYDLTNLNEPLVFYTVVLSIDSKNELIQLDNSGFYTNEATGITSVFFLTLSFF